MEVPFRGTERIGQGRELKVKENELLVHADLELKQIKKAGNKNLMAGINQPPCPSVISPRIPDLH